MNMTRDGALHRAEASEAEVIKLRGELEYYKRNAAVADLICSRAIVVLVRYADREDGELARAALAFIEDTLAKGGGQ